MKFVVFGLTISSAWGNGHATLWRGLCRALHNAGHQVVFFERDVPYYASHRDLHDATWCRLILYDTWDAIADKARSELAGADAGIVTSYCADARPASTAVLDSPVPRKVFYDLDSPVTLEVLARGDTVPYIPLQGLGDFDLVLSYVGGRALEDLKRFTGARITAPLYGSVDPDVHCPVEPIRERSTDLSYVGTYARDRQEALEQLFIAPARLRPERRFTLAGSQYPDDFPWTTNTSYLWHVPPSDHAALYCSSALTLNVTRAAMAAVGFCPSGRLFEATACGTAVVSDWWEGLDDFFTPSHELLIARTTDDVLAALDLPERDRRRLGTAARERTLACHTAAARVRELEQILESSWHPEGAA